MLVITGRVKIVVHVHAQCSEETEAVLVHQEMEICVVI